MARIDEDVQNLKGGKKWEGKTIVAFGDSITHEEGKVLDGKVKVISHLVKVETV